MAEGELVDELDGEEPPTPPPTPPPEPEPEPEEPVPAGMLGVTDVG